MEFFVWDVVEGRVVREGDDGVVVLFSFVCGESRVVRNTGFLFYKLVDFSRVSSFLFKIEGVF